MTKEWPLADGTRAFCLWDSPGFTLPWRNRDCNKILKRSNFLGLFIRYLGNPALLPHITPFPITTVCFQQNWTHFDACHAGYRTTRTQWNSSISSIAPKFLWEFDCVRLPNSIEPNRVFEFDYIRLSSINQTFDLAQVTSGTFQNRHFQSVSILSILTHPFSF